MTKKYFKKEHWNSENILRLLRHVYLKPKISRRNSKLLKFLPTITTLALIRCALHQCNLREAYSEEKGDDLETCSRLV